MIVFVRSSGEGERDREMSRRIKQPGAASRRTRRSGEPQQAQPAVPEFVGFAENQRVVSNPIFYCGRNGSPSRHKPSSGDHQLRCVYRPGSLGAFVHDPAPAPSKGSSASGIGNGKPLPLPPCRAHHGAACMGPAVVVGSSHGRLLRRRAHHHQQDDPFLAAYVACSKGSSGGAKVKRHREREEKTRRKEGDKGGVVQGCGGVSWAVSVKHAGAAMSCRNVCGVVNVRARDTPAAKEKETVEAGPKLDLSWAPVVLSARAVERRREQR
ncbi:hypothetical protein QOZ80_3BG0262990 [Eleusine coracana subsp. coracana]|nr:hypothetical protein QOZ80_3BG0262990 [Eleusine coracana subsp. coracana]